MKRGLTVVFVLVFSAILGATIWASGHAPFYKTPRAVVTYPWFITTMVDIYLAFFHVLAMGGVQGNLQRRTRGLADPGAGYLAMAAYVLIQLARLPADAKVEALLLRRR